MLRELGNKVKRMEKLGPVDILYAVHEAAEDLQTKVDRKSYLLVNSESWEIGNRQEQGDPQDLLSLDEDENKILQHKSYSEAILDLRSITVPKSWDGQIPNGAISTPPADVSPGSVFQTQISWPRRISFNANAVPVVEESKTYENASALALATFTSLLIEFVARLQNVVYSFEELSEKANFKDPIEEPAVVEHNGLWNKFRNWLKY